MSAIEPKEKVNEAAPATGSGTFLHTAWKEAHSLCIKCGFCLPVCPTYRETGFEADSPRGRLDLLYAAAQGDLPPQAIRKAMSQCLGCLACETACPSKITYRELWEAERMDAAAETTGGKFRWKAWLLRRVLLAPRTRRILAWGMFGFQRSGLHAVLRVSRVLEWIVPSLGNLVANMPPIPAPLPWGHPAQSLPDSGRMVVLFTGCVMDTLFGSVHAATVKVLEKNGFRIAIPAEQKCCGALHVHSGLREEARELARQNIQAFESTGEAPILLNSAGCGASLKETGQLLADDPQWAERAARFSARIKDVSEFLAGETLQPPERRLALRVSYDDPCHLLHAQQIQDGPRELLGLVPGLELIPLAEADWCCGSAGVYSLTQPELSRRVLARKMMHIKASGAQVIATGNPGCLLQLRLGAKRHRMKVKVLHPIELLAQAYL